MSETFEPSLLRELILAHIDAKPSSVRLSPIKTGKHNSSFWVDSTAGRFVLRIAPQDDAPPHERHFLFYERRMMRQEPTLHALIARHTGIPIAEVIGYDFSRNRIDRDYILLRALPGTPLSEAYWLDREGRARTLYEVGVHLRELHTMTSDTYIAGGGYGYLGEHHPMPPAPTWAEAFQVMWNLLLDDVVACGAYTIQEAQMFRDLLDAYSGLFDYAAPARLLHMDVWSQNILVDHQGHVTGLVDFDRALWGDPEIEFAVLDYCGISEEAFWKGYGRPRETSPAAAIRQRFYLLYEVQKYMPIRVWRSDHPEDARRFKQMSLAIAAPLQDGIEMPD